MPAQPPRPHGPGVPPGSAAWCWDAGEAGDGDTLRQGRIAIAAISDVRMSTKVPLPISLLLHPARS